MNDVCGFIVGIDAYEQAGFNTTGPCANAIAMAQWLVAAGGTPQNVFLFLAPRDEELAGKLGELERAGVNVSRDASYAKVNAFWRGPLAEIVAKSRKDLRLLFYWSGHGFAENDGTRIFAHPDYASPRQCTNVFNCKAFLDQLQSPTYEKFREQIVLVDACATYASRHRYEFQPTREVPARIAARKPIQTVYFATPVGEYAEGQESAGVLTQTALGVLRSLKSWPAQESFVAAMDAAFTQCNQKPYRVSVSWSHGEIPDRVVGRVVEDDSRASLVFNMLCKASLPEAEFRQHYLRTVSVLGEPALEKATDLRTMVEELDSLHSSYGLLQFLVRLQQVPELIAPITDWLATLPPHENHYLAEIRHVLSREREMKTIVVEVEDANEDIAGFHVLAYTSDLMPLPGVSMPPRRVRNWDEFTRSLLADLETLRSEHEIGDFQIHFLVNPPLFDRPLHCIKLPENEDTLGCRHVVVLRYRDRVRSPRVLDREAWCQYAKSLRAREPRALKALCVPCGEGPEGRGLVPPEKGICYTRFALGHATGSAPCNMAEKKELMKLLRLGLPYLYWLHRLPSSDALENVERCITRWLSGLPTLDRFPHTFTVARRNDEPYACEATLLWDDPDFIPFVGSRGVALK